MNLPVKDLKESKGFFGKLDFRFNPDFADETAACMVVGDDSFVMLLTEAVFKEFTPKSTCDATTSTEVLTALSVESRERIDRLVESAVSAGGSTYSDPRDYGFMYQHGFEDPDVTFGNSRISTIKPIRWIVADGFLCRAARRSRRL